MWGEKEVRLVVGEGEEGSTGGNVEEGWKVRGNLGLGRLGESIGDAVQVFEMYSTQKSRTGQYDLCTAATLRRLRAMDKFLKVYDT